MEKTLKNWSKRLGEPVQGDLFLPEKGISNPSIGSFKRTYLDAWTEMTFDSNLPSCGSSMLNSLIRIDRDPDYGHISYADQSGDSETGYQVKSTGQVPPISVRRAMFLLSDG